MTTIPLLHTVTMQNKATLVTSNQMKQVKERTSCRALISYHFIKRNFHEAKKKKKNTNEETK